MKHSPAPWLIDADEHSIMIADKSEDTFFIAQVRKHFKNAEANARLIAAAPELLDALQGFVDNASSNKRIADNQVEYYRNVFIKLIAKATGEKETV